MNSPKTFAPGSHDARIAFYKREIANLERDGAWPNAKHTASELIASLKAKIKRVERRQRIEAIGLRYEHDEGGAYINPSHRGLCLIIAAAHLLDMADPQGVGVGLLVEDMIARHHNSSPCFFEQRAWLRHWGFKHIRFGKRWSDRTAWRTGDDIYAEYGNCILESLTHVSAVVDGVLKGSYDDRITATGRPRKFGGVFVPD